jgi:glycosyltransferase involved in cell wall biosynthesis
MIETRAPDCDLTLVVPVRDERDNLATLHAEIVAALPAGGPGLEILFVDDGSTDGSDVEIRRLRAADPRVRLLSLASQSGQSAALDAGFRHARGRIVVTLDADLQNDPADIPRLLDALEGWDAVVGTRVRRHDAFVRRVSSRIANSIRNRLSDESIADTCCSLKAFRRAALDRVVVFEGMHRFLPTLLRMEGCRVREIPVTHRPRIRGSSKYRISNRLVPAFADLLAVRWMKRRKLRYEVKDDG